MVVKLENDTVVTQDGKLIVVGLGRGFGGQMSVAPGGATILGATEFQMPGSM